MENSDDNGNKMDLENCKVVEEKSTVLHCTRTCTVYAISYTAKQPYVFAIFKLYPSYLLLGSIAIFECFEKFFH